ncbi:hypothetical protein EDC61_12028 [Sulfuritortus calidifontis]|uniref:DUF2946 domain-containing protein n=1 Tax=Sulfuritortus calidifontis TaxID=1914471 RepID=A0A4R3JT61_9PROT|nr:hypothetical protein [Sulfuritortus calidifontis]TCS69467.1 hypothetical protein EDC61_12028 [Sulfuritortus calidifontis]
MIGQALRIFSLLLLLLALQWGGAAHALSHFDDDHDRAHTPCELCVAYAALDHGLADTTAKPEAVAQAYPLVQSSAYRALQAVEARPYLSRAPPTHLI